MHVPVVMELKQPEHVRIPNGFVELEGFSFDTGNTFQTLHRQLFSSEQYQYL